MGSGRRESKPKKSPTTLTVAGLYSFGHLGRVKAG